MGASASIPDTLDGGTAASWTVASKAQFDAVGAARGGAERHELGITLAGIRAFAAQHWRGELCEPECVRGALFPASADERARLIGTLRGAGRTNTWAGDCPVLRVLEDDSAKWQEATEDGKVYYYHEDTHETTWSKPLSVGRAGEPLGDAVRRAMNGYANQAAVARACVEGCSWVEVLEARGDTAVGKANVFVSWALGLHVGALIDALSRWLEAHPERDKDTFFWICNFCVQQTGIRSDAQANVERLNKTVRSIGHTLLFLEPWPPPAPLLRAWCLWELYHTADSGAALDVIMSTKQQARVTEALVGDFGAIMQALAMIDVRKAETRDPADKARIMDAVAASMGAQRLNEVVMQRLRQWVTDAGCAVLATLPAAQRATSSLINHIALLLQEQGKLCEALPLLEEALVRERAALGNTHQSTLSSISNIGGLLYAQGKLVRAQQMFVETLAGRRAALGDAHPSTLNSASNLGCLLQEQGKLDEARPLLEEVLAGRRAALGVSHLSTLTSMNNLGILLKAQGELDALRSLYEEKMVASRMALGDTHPSTLAAINNLGRLLQKQGLLGKALPLLEEALAGRRAALGDEHPSTLVSMNTLAYLLLAQGKQDEARILYEQALAGSRAVQSGLHPSTLVAINNLGMLLREQGRLQEARPLFEECAAGQRAAMGEKHPDALNASGNLGLLLADVGEISTALPLLEEAVAGLRAAHGDDHPHTRKFISGLEALSIETL